MISLNQRDRSGTGFTHRDRKEPVVPLRDPIKAMREAANRCLGPLIIAEGIVDTDEPSMKFRSTAEMGLATN